MEDMHVSQSRARPVPRELHDQFHRKLSTVVEFIPWQVLVNVKRFVHHDIENTIEQKLTTFWSSCCRL